MKARSDGIKKDIFGRPSTKDAFLDYQEKTSDAWDDGEDDLLRLVSSNKLSTGKNYLNNNISSIKSNNVTNSPKNGKSTSSKITNTTITNKKQPSEAANSNIPSSAGSLSSSKQTISPEKTLKFSQKISQCNTSSSIMMMPNISNNIVKNDEVKIDKFKLLLSTPSLDLDEGYLPAAQDRQESILEKKRQEYHNYLEQYYSTRHQEIHQETHRQIQIDLPRMCPSIPLFQQEVVQQIFERVLYIWAIRHPASGYVQGMNDLMTPFFVVFLDEYIEGGGQAPSMDSFKVDALSSSHLQKLEADCYWCLSKLLDGIQDNYTFAQPGIQTRINQLKDLVSRIDASLQRHLDQHRVEYIQFTFRWMNNLLMRELPLRCIVRLWDTYLSEPDGFASFHLYVCAAFLTKFSTQLQREKDFHGLMMLLQNLPTQQWTDEEVTVVLAEAYKLKFSFSGAPRHFVSEAAN